MVRIRERHLGGRTYYYLEHSMREGSRITKKERYLGTDMPAHIEKIKKEFADEIRKQRWHADMDRIQKNYAREQKYIPKSIKEKEVQNFTIKFTYDTQKIEGSTLTQRETADLLVNNIAPKDRPMQDVHEAEAHRDMFNEMLKFKKNFTLHVLLDWHWKLFEKTKPGIAGAIRKYQVGIGGSRFTPPMPVEVYPMLTEFFQWYKRNQNKIHPVELAALIHLNLVTIHPFGDGNGRVARLVMNFILNSKGYPMFDIPYKQRRSYYNALERSQTEKNDAIFLQWFIKRYVKEYKQYLKLDPQQT